MKNIHSHIYLYAKGHYERGDVVEDLKIIIGQICATDPEFLSKNDVCHYLTKIAFLHMNELFIDPLTSFRDFIFDLDPKNCWKVGYRVKVYKESKEPYDFETAVICKCLSVIQMADVRRGNKILIELDEPDPNLLPLHKKG